MSTHDLRPSPMLLSAVGALCLIVLAGCYSGTPTPTVTPEPAGEGFAIYLTDESIRPVDLDKLSHLELEDEPILGAADILSYEWATHELTLTPEAVARLQALEVRTSGRAFAACVDGAPVYAGAFWVAYSSQSFDGVIIDPILLSAEKRTVRIELGYPGASFFQGEDPRSDPTIRRALERDGKIK